MIITSKSNKLVKQIEALKQKKYRQKRKEYMVEGIKPVHDALEANAPVTQICVSQSYDNANGTNGFESYPYMVFSDDVFSSMCCTKTPQGILACIAMEEKNLADSPCGFYLYCDGVSDPGNAGTIIRIADACGCDAVLFSPNSVDIYSDKTIRASMGSFFHLPILEGVFPQWLEERKDKGYKIVGGILSETSVPYTNLVMQPPVVIVVGNEANGITDSVQSLCTDRAIIPIYGKAESLNVGVAAAVLCYEVRRQEGK